MKALTCIVLLFFCLASAARAQDSTATNVNSGVLRMRPTQAFAFDAYVEFVGAAGALSMNGEMIWKHQLAARLGVGWSLYPGSRELSIIARHELVTGLSYLFLDGDARPELGASATIILGPSSVDALLPGNSSNTKFALYAGVRFILVPKALEIRLGYTPFFDLHHYSSGFGVSIGSSAL